MKPSSSGNASSSSGYVGGVAGGQEPRITLLFRWPTGTPTIGFFSASVSGPAASAVLPVLRKVGGVACAPLNEWRVPISAHADLVREFSKPGNVVRGLPFAAVEILSGGPPPRAVEPLRTPPSLLAKLRDFQLDGVKFVVARKGRALIGDEMGCGKTVTALAAASHYAASWPLLILAPAALRLNWRDEIRTFLPQTPEESIHVISSSTEAKKILSSMPAASSSSGCCGGVYIVAYSILAKLVKDGTLAPGRFKIVIADESHQLKNLEAARTKASLVLIQAAAQAILLSGTPVPNRPRELFPQLFALNRKLFPDPYAFATRYCAGRKAPWGFDDSGQSNADELNALLHEHVLTRKLKRDVLKDLPAKIRNVFRVPITMKSKRCLEELSSKMDMLLKQVSVVKALPNQPPELLLDLRQKIQGLQMKIFATVGEGKVDALITHVFSSVLAPLTGCNFISVACAVPAEADVNDGRKRKHPVDGDIPASNDSFLSGGGFFPEHVAAAELSAASPCKARTFQYDALSGADEKRVGFLHGCEVSELEAVSASGGANVSSAETAGVVLDSTERVSKLIIFAHHSAVLDALESACSSRGVKYVRIDGMTSANKKHGSCKLFRDDATVQVALLSITAAGVGLSFVASHRAIFAELYWVPGDVQQAEDRIHRLGQMKTVIVDYCVTDNVPGDFDERLWEMLRKKMVVIQAAIDNSDFATMAAVGYVPNVDDADDDAPPPDGPKQGKVISIFDDEEFEGGGLSSPGEPVNAVARSGDAHGAAATDIDDAVLNAMLDMVDEGQKPLVKDDDEAISALLDEIERNIPQRT
jgi:SNF2 family DNA or RNA helicase